jgi:WD40 repeat protein
VAGAGEINRRTFPRVHRSFSDFITSSGAGDFRLDPINSDGELAIQCLRQLGQLWDLEMSEQPEFRMPAQLPYAILHWCSHLTRVVGVNAEEAAADDDSLHTNAENMVPELENTASALAGVDITEKSGPAGDSECITVSPDGRRVAFGLANGSIQLRDTRTGNEVLPMLGHTGTVFFVAFSPDGTRLVSASADNTVRLWNSITGAMIGSPLEGHSDTVFSAVFSQDGKQIVSASADKTIRIWNSDTGAMVLGPLQGHTDWVFCATFSPDGQHVVSGSSDKTVCIWSSKTGKLVLGPLQGHISPLRFAVFSTDGRHIISCSRHRSILVWDSQTGERVLALSNGDANTKLAFTDSETAPYIVTPPRTQGTSTIESYYFDLDGGQEVVGGVTNSGIDTWLYAHNKHFVVGRYLGQLILSGM